MLQDRPVNIRHIFENNCPSYHVVYNNTLEGNALGNHGAILLRSVLVWIAYGDPPFFGKVRKRTQFERARWVCRILTSKLENTFAVVS